MNTVVDLTFVPVATHEIIAWLKAKGIKVSGFGTTIVAFIVGFILIAGATAVINGNTNGWEWNLVFTQSLIATAISAAWHEAIKFQ